MIINNAFVDTQLSSPIVLATVWKRVLRADELGLFERLKVLNGI